MVSPKFMRPKAGRGTHGGPSPNLFVANCGPAVGLSLDAISSAFAAFGDLKGVFPADDTGARVIVSYSDEASAQAALSALDGRPFDALGGRVLHIRFSVHRLPSPTKSHDSLEVALTTSELNIPGIYLLSDFVTAKEEELLMLGRGTVLQREGFNIMALNFAIKQETLILSVTWATFRHLSLPLLKELPPVLILMMLQKYSWTN